VKWAIQDSEHPHRSSKETPLSSDCDGNLTVSSIESGSVTRPADGERRLSPDLEQVIAAWPALPPAVRAVIAALVEASKVR
jgi:hypothetical protein